MFDYLECCTTCGFLYVILTRFSLTTVPNDDDPVVATKLYTPPSRIQDLNRFLTSLNNEFRLADRLKHLRANFNNAHLTKALFLVNYIRLGFKTFIDLIY